MLSLNQTRRAMRSFRAPPPTQVWAKIVALAVTHNGYSDVIQIRVLMDLKTGDYDDLLNLAGELSSTVYDDHAMHFRMHQLSALIRKYPELELTGASPEAKAMEVFQYAERKARDTNLRIAALERGNDGTEAPAIHYMQRYIAYVLRNASDVDEDGPTSEPNMQNIFALSRFTGGASLGVHGNATNLYRKLLQGADGSWTVGSQALDLFTEALWEHSQIREMILFDEEKQFACYDRREFVRRVRASCKIVSHNKIAFVPKDATVHRTVAAEPTANTYVLKGADLEMRSMLARAGIDLRFQDPNCQMAFLGSKEWRSDDPYCTIDLKTASGMLAYLLAKLALGKAPSWFALLDSLRSSYYELPNGEFGKYECFASMGNGSCFPLQTLVFASICHTAYAERGEAPDFRVYGDDIIVRRRVFARVIQLLGFFGFEPNTKKTFSEGPFRESCGADYHDGVNVRPVYLDEPLDSLERIFRFHNQSLKRSDMVRLYFDEIRQYLRKLVPRDLRFVTDYDPTCSYLESDDFEVGQGAKGTFDSAFWGSIEDVMRSPLCFYNRHTQSWGFTVLAMQPKSDIIVIANENELYLYEQAKLMAALSGCKSERPFTLRYSASYAPRLENREVKWADAERKLTAVA